MSLFCCKVARLSVYACNVTVHSQTREGTNEVARGRNHEVEMFLSRTPRNYISQLASLVYF